MFVHIYVAIYLYADVLVVVVVSSLHAPPTGNFEDHSLAPVSPAVNFQTLFSAHKTFGTFHTNLFFMLIIFP